MALRSFFQNARPPQSDEDLSHTVKNNIDEFFVKNKQDQCEEFKKCSTRAIDIKRCCGFKEISKIVLSGLTWAVYHEIKTLYREESIHQIHSDLEKNQISLSEAIAKTLSGIGEEDLHSFKYLLIRDLFGLTARTDEEAKKMIQMSIDVLNPENYLEMTSANSRFAHS